EPHQPSLRRESRVEAIELSQVHEARGHAHGLQHLVEQSKGPAVHVVPADHMIPRAEAVKQGEGRRASARKREAVAPAFERSEARLQRLPGGVPAARVLEQLWLTRLA